MRASISFTSSATTAYSYTNRSSVITPRSRRQSCLSEEPMTIYSDWDGQRGRGSAYALEDFDDVEPLIVHIGSRGWENDPPEPRANPEGYLFFLEDNWFRFSVGLVILINLLVLAVGLVYPDLRWLDDASDSFFLAVYVTELMLRLGHFRLKFFYWMPDAPWNICDLVIVLAGILDEWVLPLMCHNINDSDVLGLRLIRGLRILVRLMRLLRVVRFVRMFIIADLTWVDSPEFSGVVAVVILVNALILGLDTDYHSPIWCWLTQLVLAFFAFEVICRLRLRRSRFFTDPDENMWNILDILIVFCGIVPQLWLEEWQDGASQWARMLTLLRVAGLVRIARRVRVAKCLRSAQQIAVGIALAMQSMCWVLVLTVFILYSLAIVTTRMIGWGELVGDPNSIPEDTREMFATLGDSMFALFALMNGHQWHRIIPILDMLPWTKLLFVTFTICGSWALLSVMTGVVSDHILSQREKHLLEDKEERDERRERLHISLSMIFAAADKDGSGRLTRDEFVEILNSPYQAQRLLMATNAPLKEIAMIFDWLDVEGLGTVSFAEFCEGLDCMKEKVTGRRLLNIDCGVKRQIFMLQQIVDGLGDELCLLRRDMLVNHAIVMDRIKAVLEPNDGEGDSQSGGYVPFRRMGTEGSRLSNSAGSSVSQAQRSVAASAQPAQPPGLMRQGSRLSGSSALTQGTQASEFPSEGRRSQVRFDSEDSAEGCSPHDSMERDSPEHPGSPSSLGGNRSPKLPRSRSKSSLPVKPGLRSKRSVSFSNLGDI